MKKCFAVFCFLLGCVAAVTAQDITNLEKIAPVASFTRTQKGITLTATTLKFKDFADRVFAQGRRSTRGPHAGSPRGVLGNHTKNH